MDLEAQLAATQAQLAQLESTVAAAAAAAAAAAVADVHTTLPRYPDDSAGLLQSVQIEVALSPPAKATPGTLVLRKVRPIAKLPRGLLKKFLRGIIFGSWFGGRIVKEAEGLRPGILIAVLFRCAYCIAWTKTGLAVTFPKLPVGYPSPLANQTISPDQGQCSFVYVESTGYSYAADGKTDNSSCPVQIKCRNQCSNKANVDEVESAAIVFILGLSYITYMYVP